MKKRLSNTGAKDRTRGGGLGGLDSLPRWSTARPWDADRLISDIVAVTMPWVEDKHHCPDGISNIAELRVRPGRMLVLG